MKRFRPVPPSPVVVSLLLLASAACAQSGARTQDAPASSANVRGPSATPTPSSEEAKAREKEREIQNLVDTLAGKAAEDDALSGAAQIVVGPAGDRQQRIVKSRQYYVVRGRLYNAVVRDKDGVEILRQDDEAWYVAAPDEIAPADAAAAARNLENPNLPPIIEISEDDAEVVAPPASKTRLVLEDLSEGLPTSGMWRETFALGDLDGDGRPEIVSPPPRLSALELRIFRLVGKSWVLAPAKFEDPELIGFEYGGTALGDFDGDGRLDIVFGRHGGGPAIAYNQGGFRFRVESRGLPRDMSTRAMDTGDLDGDGKLDVIAISDQPEYTSVRTAEAEGNATARQPRPNGYVPGFDVRAFLQRGDKFEENHGGLDQACFGYAISVVAAPRDGKEPFFGTGCRYRGLSQVVYDFDRKAGSFRAVSNDVAERYAYHNGVAAGTYRGMPALFMSYIKSIPQGGTRQASGNGVNVYYRDGGTWKRKRVFKSVETAVTSSGIAVGDLDGDGLDDVAFADDGANRVRVFFQLADGSFEELARDLAPRYVNHGTAARIADVDGDGRRDIVLMFQFLTGDETRAGGFRAFRNVR